METDITTQLAQEMGIPIGGNPMKPGDIVIHPSFNKLPPKCPRCQALLYPTQQDPSSGNQLFECLNGDLANAGHYMAVYRVGTNTWGQRPGAERDDWEPPVLGSAPPKEHGRRVRQSGHRRRKRNPAKRKPKAKSARVAIGRESMPQDG